MAALGWSLLLLGFVVLRRSPDRPAALAFWRLSLLTATALGAYPAAAHGAPWVLALQFVVVCLGGPALLELALVFPAGPHLLARRPLVRLLLWLPALALLPLYPLIAAGTAARLTVVPDVVLCAYIAGATVRLLWVCVQPRSPQQRAQLQYLALGLLGGVLPPVLLTLAPRLLTGRPLVPAGVTLLALGALPLCVGLAIARVELFGIALRRRTRWLLRRVTLPAMAAGVVGLGMLAAQEPWRLLLPFGEVGAVAAVAWLSYARRPALTRPRQQAALGAAGLALGGHMPAPSGSERLAGAGSHRTRPRAQHLTPREIEILTCAAQGLQTRAIAERLHMGERTVGTHLASIYEKLEVHTRRGSLRRPGARHSGARRGEYSLAHGSR